MSDRRVVVVGAGIAGLACAMALRRTAPDVDILVLEAKPRVGGLVETERTPEGFIVEYGADCLVTTKPWGLAATRDAGLGNEIVVGTGGRQSYVARHDGLVPMPSIFAGVGSEAMLSLLRTPLLTLAGKVRVALEPMVRPRYGTDDESVRAFAIRRFGFELATTVVDPLMGGIYGGDTSSLSAEACLPKLRDFERAHGSVILGIRHAIRTRRRRTRAGETLLPPVVSLRGGIGTLPEALARRLGVVVRTGIAVRRVTQAANGWFRVETAEGPIMCNGVVLATPAWQAPSIVEELSPDLAADLDTVTHKALDCVTLAWPRREIPHSLDGTGWVRAAGNRRATLACTWSSEKWPGRAPTGFALVRSVLSLSGGCEDDLVTAACDDLRDLVGVTAPPAFTRVRRLPRATPIYEVGHIERVARLAAHASALGAVALAGNAYRGIGVPDCVASGEDAARAVLDAMQRQCGRHVAARSGSI